MFTVIAAWTILFFVLAGLGQSVRRWFGLKLAGFDTWIGAVWMGYAVAIAALELWHLLLPIDWHICLLLGTLGLGGLIWHAAACRRPRLPIGRTLLTLVIFAPMAIWVANRALDAQLDFDTGLYHLSIIRWLNDYPAVPGLGNLHYRLAFNQTFFLFVAALNVSPFFNQGMHIANSFLLVTLALQLTDRLVYSLFFPRQVSPDRLLGMLFLPVVIYRASRQPYSANISSASPDLSVF
ncbi:MAG TPA: hypothetical protein VMT34_13795, partial [Aggregatilineales bacterium]|nr:hypothetical protein [Aggregatilineales bacterium]